MSIPGFVSEPTVTQNYGTCEAGNSPARPADRLSKQEDRRNRGHHEDQAFEETLWDSVDQPQPCKKHRRRRHGIIVTSKSSDERLKR